MLPVASPTNCRKSYPFADEADTFQNDFHNKGVVSLRGNSFFKRKKHSGYENLNACGKM